jgi:two-component system, cell cycle response regulator
MSERILILDDETSILDILTQLLTPQGYICETANSPLKALEILKRQSFSILLTDVKMPEMNGIEVVKQARSIDPTLSIIIVTALTDVSHAIEAIRAGADDYVLKPFNLRDITDAVTKGLDTRKTRLSALNYQVELEDRVTNATSDLERVHDELQATKQYLENILHGTMDAIMTFNNEGRIEFVNSGVLSMLGYENEPLSGKGADQILGGGFDELNRIREDIAQHKTFKNYETELRHRDGHRVPVNVSLSQVPDLNGRGMAVLAICKDITEQMRLQHELREMSVRDSLTNLYNQRHFYDVIEKEVERARRQHRPLSLLLFDVDKFKGFNDTLGHLEGDRVLSTVGEIVVECTREHVDMGFRYGGDEFTVVLPETDLAQAQVVAERVRESFQSKDFNGLTLSLGVAQYKEGMDVRQFVQSADELMYHAKRSGGNRVVVKHFDDQSKAEEEVG